MPDGICRWAILNLVIFFCIGSATFWAFLQQFKNQVPSPFNLIATSFVSRALSPSAGDKILSTFSLRPRRSTQASSFCKQVLRVRYSLASSGYVSSFLRDMFGVLKVICSCRSYNTSSQLTTLKPRERGSGERAHARSIITYGFVLHTHFAC